MSIKVFLFDMDGTLVVHNDLMPAVMQHTLHDFGLDVEVDKLLCSGKTDSHNIKHYLNLSGYAPEEQDETAVMLCHKMAQKTVDLLPLYGMDACPGVLTLLTELQKRNVLMGLLTGNAKDVVPPKLDAAGIDPAYFRFGAYGDENQNRSELARMAIERAGKILGNDLQASQVLVVGDTPRDVECARDAGAASLVVATGEFSKEQLLESGPDFYMDDLVDWQIVVDLL